MSYIKKIIDEENLKRQWTNKLWTLKSGERYKPSIKITKKEVDRYKLGSSKR